MRIAPEGRPFIVGAAIIGVVLVLLGWMVSAVAWAVVLVWVVAFFRDPEPKGPPAPDVLFAPADGKVVSVIETDEPAFFGERAVRISIFMNVFDCHVNRYPCDGVVAYRHYNRGAFGHAGTDKASLDNEQASTGLETSRGKVLVRQIAGLIARRIVTYSKVGDKAVQGERFGIIRFGSRVDVFMPVGSRVNVKLGQLTSAGVTLVGELPAP